MPPNCPYLCPGPAVFKNRSKNWSQVGALWRAMGLAVGSGGVPRWSPSALRPPLAPVGPARAPAAVRPPPFVALRRSSQPATLDIPQKQITKLQSRRGTVARHGARCWFGECSPVVPECLASVSGPRWGRTRPRGCPVATLRCSPSLPSACHTRQPSKTDHKAAVGHECRNASMSLPVDSGSAPRWSHSATRVSAVLPGAAHTSHGSPSVAPLSRHCAPAVSIRIFDSTEISLRD